MEYIKRVWAEKFTLTDEQKADVKAGKPVEWQGENVKHNGGDRFLCLLTIGGTHQAIHEGQWLVRDTPNVLVMWDEQFKGSYGSIEPVQTATQPLRSAALEAFLKKHQPAEPAKSETPAPEEPAPTEPEQSQLVDIQSPSLNGQSHE